LFFKVSVDLQLINKIKRKTKSQITKIVSKLYLVLYIL